MSEVLLNRDVSQTQQIHSGSLPAETKPKATIASSSFLCTDANERSSFNLSIRSPKKISANSANPACSAAKLGCFTQPDFTKQCFTKFSENFADYYRKIKARAEIDPLA